MDLDDENISAEERLAAAKAQLANMKRDAEASRRANQAALDEAKTDAADARLRAKDGV